jgi:hypothetical protein
MNRRSLLLAAFALAAAVGTTEVFDADGRRVGTVREQAGGRVDLYGKDGQREGWGRCDQHGTCELFDMRGERIGTSRDGNVRTLNNRKGGAARDK